MIKFIFEAAVSHENAPAHQQFMHAMLEEAGIISDRINDNTDSINVDNNTHDVNTISWRLRQPNVISRNISMPSSLRRRLDDFYAPFNQLLKETLSFEV